MRNGRDDDGMAGEVVFPCYSARLSSTVTFISSRPTLILSPRRSVQTDIGGTVRGRGISASSIHLARFRERRTSLWFLSSRISDMLGRSFPGPLEGPGRSRATHLRLASAGMLLTHSRNAISSTNLLRAAALDVFVISDLSFLLCCVISAPCPASCLLPRLQCSSSLVPMLSVSWSLALLLL